MQTQYLLQEINLLSPELQKQVFDFIMDLRKQQNQPLIKRTVGEYRNQIVIHDDFNDPLLF